MGTVSSISGTRATGTDLGATPERRDLQWFGPFIAVARALWPVKTAQNLAHKTQVSERAASFWLAGKYDMSLDAARALLRSEDGYAFPVALMGDCDARWWQRVKLRYDSGKLKREIAAQQKHLAELINRSLQEDMKLD